VPCGVRFESEWPPFQSGVRTTLKIQQYYVVAARGPRLRRLKHHTNQMKPEPIYTVTCIPIARQRVRKHIPATRLRNNRGSGDFCGSASRLYNADLTQLELELGRVLEMAVEGD
jgi:hypothetical protein